MRRRACGAAVAALAALAVAAPATYAAGQPLNAYRVKADGAAVNLDLTAVDARTLGQHQAQCN